MGLVMLGPSAGLFAVQFCVPVILLCWFCCWSDPDESETSSVGTAPKTPIVITQVPNRTSSRKRRISLDFFSRRPASSTVSLHIPTSAGQSNGWSGGSVPSVLHEVLQRRTWTSSANTLAPDAHSDSEITMIPLRDYPSTPTDIRKPCKKHYTGIKSSKNNKENIRIDDFKDRDIMETSFYIGDKSKNVETDDLEINDNDATNKAIEIIESTSIAVIDTNNKYMVKEEKQCINEMIKSRDLDLDRSGAVHRIDKGEDVAEFEERRLSVEPVGYESCACYLTSQSPEGVVQICETCAPPHRHSEGDILGQTAEGRPQSGAFSEGDVLYDSIAPVGICEPTFDKSKRKETAI